MKKKKMSIKKVEKCLNRGLIIACTMMVCIDSIVFGSIIYKNKKRKKEHIETINNIELSINYSYEDVYNLLNKALDNNSNLSVQEREYIRDNLWVFLDNKDYLDIHYLKETLEHISTTYNSKIKNRKRILTLANYDDDRKEITFHNANGLDDVDDFVFTHELFHSMQKKYYKEFNSYLIETINTIFNENYTNVKESDLYKGYYNYTKMLIEIIGIEPIRKYQCYTMSQFIVDALVEIYGTEEEAYELLYDLDNYKYLYEKKVAGKSNNKKLESLKNRIIQKIGIYYEKKYGFSMDNDLVMLYYYDYSKLCSIIKNKFFIDDKDNFVIIENNINYFIPDYKSELVVCAMGNILTKNIYINSNGLIEEHDEIDNKNITYVIDNSNRYIDILSVHR